MDKFHGTFDELRDAIASTGIAGTWVDEQGATPLHRFRGCGGEVLNWWPSRGTILIQGKKQQAFEEAVKLALQASATSEDKKGLACDERERLNALERENQELRTTIETIRRMSSSS